MWLALLLVAAVGCAGTRHAAAPGRLPRSAVPATPPERVRVFVPDVPAPHPATAGEVTLAQLLAYADANAPAIGVARARSRRGDAAVEAASLIFQDNPEVGLGIGGRTIRSSTALEAEVSVQQRVEIAGERGLRVKTARRGREVALAELDEARWAVHVQVHTLFLSGLVARERVSAAERVVRFAQELERIATRRIEAGADSPLTQLVAQAELAQARGRLVEVQREEKAQRIRLAEITGWPSNRPPSLRGVLPAVRRTRVTDALVRLAAAHHPSFRVRALAIAEARSRVKLEAREAWPEPTLGVAYGREGERGANADIWLFTLGLPIPVWNRNQGGRARAEVALDVAQRERKALHTTWRGRLERAAERLNASAERVQIYGTNVLPAVERNLTLIRRAYDLGELDIHAVSQTRERVLATQSRAIDARAAYVRALAELEGLVGTELDDSALQKATP